MPQKEWNLGELEGVQLDDEFILQHISNDEKTVISNSIKGKPGFVYAGERSFPHYSSGSSLAPCARKPTSPNLTSPESSSGVLHPSESKDVPQQQLIRICYEFVDCFLVKKWETLKLMDNSIVQCLDVLNSVQEVLEDFMKKLELIQHEIGDVREQLTYTTTHLENNRASEAVLWKVISQLLLPPEIVSLLTRASDERLGEQYKIGLKMLLRYLHNRRSTWKEMEKEGKEVACCASSSVEPEVTTGLSSPIRNKNHEERALREVRFSFKNCKPYHDLVSVMDSVTVLACVKVKKFLSSQLQLLAVPLTNICIQQDHCLKEYIFYVSFLKNAPDLLRHPRIGGVEPSTSSSKVPFQIANALYGEFQQEYSTVLSSVCLEKVKNYLAECMTVELDASPLSKNTTILPSFASASASPLLPGGVEGGKESLAASVGVTSIHLSIPPISDMLAAVGGVEPWNLGSRGTNLFRKLFAGPLIPLLEKLQLKKHPYEETIRSLFRLLCDMATHEYLFSFHFFSGDTKVFSNSFYPILEFVCDFIRKLIKKPPAQQEGQFSRWTKDYKGRRGSASGNGATTSGVSTSLATEDSYGLLILIRLCHEFHYFMNAERHLPCLNGFFDTLLKLLWPAFMQTVQMQRIALRCIAPGSLAACLAGPSTSTIGKKMAFVHPLTQCVAEYLRHLLSIILGTTNLNLQLPSTEDKTKTERGKEEGRGLNGPPHSLSSVLSFLPSKMTKDGRRKIDWRSIQQQACAILDEAGRGDIIPYSHEQVLSLMEEMIVLRREVVARLEELAMYILQGSAQPSTVSEKEISLFKTAFVLNNIYYMYAKMYHTPVIQSVSPPPMQPIQGEGETQSHPGSKNSRFRGGEITKEERRDGEQEEDEDTEPREEEDTVGNRCNLEDIWNIYESSRKRFVQLVLRKYLSEMWELAPERKEDEKKNEEESREVAVSMDPVRVRRAAERFAAEWVTMLNGVRDTTLELISDPGHQKEVMAQTCMEYLLLNTRFHGVANQCTVDHPEQFKGVSLRNLLVTNQKLLGHMRTFTAFPV